MFMTYSLLNHLIAPRENRYFHDYQINFSSLYMEKCQSNYP